MSGEYFEGPKITTYVSGPMSGLPDLNFPAFHAAAQKLRGMGFEVVNPAELNPDAEAKGHTWATCMRVDIKALMECDHIFMLPGWRASRGAKLEHHIAKSLGMTIGGANE